MDLATLHNKIADQIRDTGSIIDDAARDRAILDAVILFNYKSNKIVTLEDFTTATDFEWLQISNLIAAMLLEQMASHNSGDVAASALGQSFERGDSKSQDYRAAANRYKKEAYNNLVWTLPNATGGATIPASAFVGI